MRIKRLHTILSVITYIVGWMVFANTLGAQPLSGNYTINKSIPASSSNFVSFQALFTKLSVQGVNGAVSVLVVSGSGPYTEQVQAVTIPGAGVSNPITINGNNEILRYTASISTDRHTLRFDGASYITLRNLTVEALGSTYAWGIQFINNADNNTLENCVVRVPNYSGQMHNEANGIVVSGSNTSAVTGGSAAKNLAIRGCTVTGGPSGGPWCAISLFPQSNGSITAGITISHCVIQNFRSMGVFLTQCKGVKVIGNFFSRPTLTSVGETSVIKLVNGNREDSIIGNRIFDCYKAVPSTSNNFPFYGINIENSFGSIVVANNTIYENNSLVSWYGISMSCSPGTKIVHNTISADNSSISNSSNIIGFQHNNSTCSVSTGSEFRNNVVSVTTPGTGLRYAVYQKANAITFNNNNLYVAGSAAYIGWVGSNYQTLADWQGASGAGAPFDVNSEAVEPKFLNLPSGNLSIAAVELDNLGYASGVQGDITNFQRSNSTPDPGAYEFSIDANVSRIIKPAAAACEAGKDSVSVWIVNNSGLAITDFTVEYKVNAGVAIDEIFTGTINAGDSGRFTFKQLITFPTSGSYDISARLKGKPFVGPLTVVVSPVPTGFSILKGAKYKGQYNAGDTLHPDILSPPDSAFYELNVSGSFSNTSFGTTWGLLAMEIKERVGKNKIATADTAVQTPGIGGNGVIRFAPNTTMPGDTVLLRVQPYSLITGCPAVAIWRSIAIVPRPKALFSFTNTCEGAPLQFTNMSSISKGSVQYKWYFGDNDSSTLVHPSKIYNFPGLYKVTLIAISDIGYTDSFSTMVTVFDAPDVNFSYGNRCEGTAISFADATRVNYGAGIYSWDFGDGFGQSASQNPSYLYSAPNIYLVRLKVTDSKGCSSSATMPVTFSKNPSAAFSVPPLNCNQKKVAFTNNSQPAGFTGYTWDFGDGKQGSSFHIEHTFDTAGDFPVKLIALNQFGCGDTIIKQVTLLKSPGVGFIVSSQCAMQPVTFSNTTDEPTGGVNYTWSFGDGDTSYSPHAGHSYSSIGTYTITLKAKANNGCNALLEKTFEFFEQPVSFFTMPALGCTNSFISMVNGSKISKGNLTYLWDFGNGDIDNGETPAYRYLVPGTYSVTLSAFSGTGCGHSFVRQIMVSQVPESGFTIKSRNTGDGYMVLSPIEENGAGFYKWLYGDAQNSNLKVEHHHQYKTQGIFTISLQVVNDACASTTSKQIALNPLDVGAAEITKSINVYPNPTTGNGVMEIPEGLALYSAQLVSITGQVLAADCIDTNSINNGRLAFDFKDQASGVYLVKLITSEGILFQKVTITAR